MDNPYQAPVQATSKEAKGETAESTVKILQQTRPWVLMMGILCALGAGLMMLGGCSLLLIGFTGAMGVEIGFMGVAYIVMAILYIVPGLFLFKYVIAIGRLVNDRSTTRLNDALASQKSFWKFIGIAAILFIVLYILFVIGVVFLSIGAEPAFAPPS